jgi:hypothetical protein
MIITTACKLQIQIQIRQRAKDHSLCLPPFAILSNCLAGLPDEKTCSAPSTSASLTSVHVFPSYVASRMSFFVKRRENESTVGGRSFAVRWGKTKSMIGGVYSFLSACDGGLGVGKMALDRRRQSEQKETQTRGKSLGPSPDKASLKQLPCWHPPAFDQSLLRSSQSHLPSIIHSAKL